MAKRASRTDQIQNPVRVGSRLDQREHDMLVKIAEHEQRPVRTMIRVMIKRCIDQAILDGVVEPVPGYVVPAQVVKNHATAEEPIEELQPIEDPADRYA